MTRASLYATGTIDVKSLSALHPFRLSPRRLVRYRRRSAIARQLNISFTRYAATDLDCSFPIHEADIELLVRNDWIDRKIKFRSWNLKVPT